MMTTLEIILGLLLGTAHIFGGRIVDHAGLSRAGSRSFVAGVSVTYVFLFLLPDLYERAGHFREWLFLMMLAGFVIAHISQRYLHRHATRGKMGQELVSAHFITLFVYYFVIGFSLHFVLKENTLDGLLFFVPLAFYASIGSASFSSIGNRFVRQRVFRWLMFLSSLLGIMSARLLSVDLPFFHALLGVVTGSFLYVAILEYIPGEKKSKPVYFLFGAFIYTLVIVWSWISG